MTRFLSEDELQADQQGEHALAQLEDHQAGDQGRRGRSTSRSTPIPSATSTATPAGRDQTAGSFEDLCEPEGVSPGDVQTADSDWLDGLAEFLRDPWTSVVLVMLGITCLILELKMPGVGLPGVVAAICFVLFFWSHSQLNGQITWLAILLFVLGLS